MIFFNVRRLAVVLAWLVAVTPVVEVSAAVTQVSTSQAASMFQNHDVSSVLQAAGLVPGTLYSTLVYQFNASYKSYAGGVSINNAKLQSLFNSYVAAVSVANAATATVAAVNTAMQSCMTLLAAVMAYLEFDGGDASSKVLANMILPLANVPVYTQVAGQSLDQTVANNFVQELSMLLMTQQAASSGQQANVDNNMLQQAAAQLGLQPPTAAAMQAVINAAGCANQPTIQKQINCAIAWYQNQQALLKTINDGIGAITAATTALNSLVLAATTAISNAVSTYGDEINNATDTSAVTAAYGAGLAAVNGVYPALIGASGTIAAQNTIVTGQTPTLNTNIAQINSTIFGSQLTATQSSLSAAQSGFASALSAANSAFPPSLPAALDSNSAQNYSGSAPGSAILTLSADQQALSSPVTAVAGLVTSLNGVISAATTTFTTDKTNGITAIDAATNSAGVATALANALNAINAHYGSLQAAGSSYSTALASANALQSNLAKIATSHPQLTDVATAQQTLSTALSTATTDFPVLPGGTTFTAANAASTYATSVPGQVIVALSAEATKQNNSFGGGGLSTGSAVGIAIGVLAGLGTLVAGVWAWNKFKNDGTQDVIDEAETGIELTPLTQKAIGQAQDDNDVINALDADPVAVAALTPAAGKAVASELGLAGNDAVDLVALQRALIDALPADPPAGSITAAYDQASALVQTGSEQGFTPEQILNMAAEGSVYLPEGFSGTIVDAVTLVANTITANPSMNGATVSPTEFQTAAALQNTGGGPSGGPGGKTAGGDSGGTGGDTPGSGAGSTGGDVAGAKIYNDLVDAGKAVTQATVTEAISAGKLTKADLQADINALGSQIETLQQEAEASDTNAGEEAANLLAAQNAEKAALDDPNTPFADDPAGPA